MKDDGPPLALFWVVWIIVGLMAVGSSGVLIWAIIAVVNYVTSK
jgi:hypothetical protein